MAVRYRRIWFPSWKLLLSLVAFVFLMNFTLRFFKPDVEVEQQQPDKKYDFQKRKNQIMRKLMQKILKG